MKRTSYPSVVLVIALALVLGACSGLNLPNVSVPAVDKQARDFGDFSGITVNFDGGLSFDKISSGLPTGGGNVWPLVNLDLQNDRLIVRLTDGRFVVNIGDLHTALNFPSMAIVAKFTGGTGLLAPEDQKTLFVGPNLVDCVGVAPQQCMLVRENPEDDWKYFYDQIEGFTYEEGYLHELKVAEETVANPAADSSALRYKLVEVVSQAPVTIELAGPTWMLETMDGKAPLAKSEITAIFGDDGRLYGSAGCNSYTTGYQVGGNTITIQPAATTRMACAETGVMEQEAAYLANLEKTKTFEIVGYRLSLMDGEGEVILTFMAEQP